MLSFPIILTYIRNRIAVVAINSFFRIGFLEGNRFLNTKLSKTAI